ncbi:MAG: hypothetical protein KBG72_04695, partial [Agrobacterium sp.]|nr:hypothetical protein [Agrobacterium sp.]
MIVRAMFPTSDASSVAVTFFIRRLDIKGNDSAMLGPVDKVDSQISRSVIQDCFLGGSFGSRRPDRYGMADHRGVVA